MMENFQVQAMKNSSFNDLLRVSRPDHFFLLLALFNVLYGIFSCMWYSMHGVYLPMLKKPRQPSGPRHFNVILSY